MTYYILVGIIFLVSSIIVNITFRNKLKVYDVDSFSKMNGKEIAEKMLLDNNIIDVNVLQIPEKPKKVKGEKKIELTDHYNVLNKTINLSKKIFNERNYISIAIAAHECGHALQHKLGYNLLMFRNSLTHILNLSSKLTNLSIMFGMTIFYGSGGKISIVLKIGVVLFLLVVLFSIITLPIEFDASNRALLWIKKNNIVNNAEYKKIKTVLMWATMTYIVSVLGNLTQFFYFISFFDGFKRTQTKN